MRDEGFQIIEPHRLTFSEKINYFNKASIVIGPNSAGFSNLIFSRPGTKVLIFSNLQRSIESYLSFFYQHFDLKFMTETGTDTDQANSHSDFEIPIEKIKIAYSEMINDNSK